MKRMSFAAAPCGYFDLSCLMAAVSVCNACHLLLLHVGVLTSLFGWMRFPYVMHVICCSSVSISVPPHLKLHARAQCQHIPDMSVDAEMSADLVAVM